MIFKKLILKNFMSYSSADVDLSGIHTACLIGQNGAGKSTLLDAITWTLWEEGRARTDELIKLGTNEMSCEVDFFMEDELYKVYRSRTKGLKNSQGKSNLEFQIFNQKENSWLSLSKSAVRQTQELITKTLRMDHNAFINSVYLQQGKADEFTTKKPNERKQILSDILGLQLYDELSLLAHKKVRDVEEKVSVETRLIDELKIKISAEEELKDSYSKAHELVLGLEQEYNKIKNDLYLKEKELNEKKHTLKQIDTLTKTKESQASLLSSLASQLAGLKNKEAKCNELIKSKNEIEEKYKGYISLKENIETLDVKQANYLKLSEEKNKLEYKLKETVQEIEKDIAIYKSKLNDKGKERELLTSKLSNEKRFYDYLLPEAEEVVERFQNMQNKLSFLQSEGQELKHKKELHETELKNIESKKDGIEQKINTLENHDHSEPCPLCKGEIKDKKTVTDSYNKELLMLGEEKKSLVVKIESVQKELVERRAQYKQLLEEISTYGKSNLSPCFKKLEEIRQEKIGFFQVESIDSEKAVSFLKSQLEVSKNEFQKIKSKMLVVDEELTSFKKEYEQLQKLQQSSSTVTEISNKLSNIKQELNELSYDQAKHNELKKSLKELEGILVTYNLLQQANEDLNQLVTEITDVSHKIILVKEEVKKLDGLIYEVKQSVEGVTELEEETLELKNKENQSFARLDEEKKNRIVSERELDEIKKAKAKIKEKEDTIKNTLTLKGYYEKLERAFSKNGIQIAIIETVVPEIEKEANRILNRLTDNQMHIALRTQKEKKTSSGLVETLDVIISDDAGTRSYELYSGGEAFKIDFALRLALSKLLANRAGARLQTLVIDEGFSSQDSAGRERLVEVIRSIESEFELMLIVTHLDELKESFPVQLQVYKDEEGSHVELVI